VKPKTIFIGVNPHPLTAGRYTLRQATTLRQERGTFKVWG